MGKDQPQPHLSYGWECIFNIGTDKLLELVKQKVGRLDGSAAQRRGHVCRCLEDLVGAGLHALVHAVGGDRGRVAGATLHLGQALITSFHVRALSERRLRVTNRNRSNYSLNNVVIAYLSKCKCNLFAQKLRAQS